MEPELDEAQVDNTKLAKHLPHFGVSTREAFGTGTSKRKMVKRSLIISSALRASSGERSEQLMAQRPE